MKLLYLLFVIIFILVILSSITLNITGRFGELSSGEIFGLSISPVKPLFGEEAKISLGIKNPEDTENSYKLVYFITKDGIVKFSSDIGFTLLPNRTIELNPTFIPDDLGEHQLVVQLYDKFETKLFDTVTKKFDVVSEIGPFDLRIELPTSIITPGENIPTFLTIGNLGEKGTEVNVNVKVKCYDQSDIQNSFFVFLEPKDIKEQLINIASCKETGLHEITASIIYLNRTWIAAVNQLYLQESFLDISYTIPELIEVIAGESKQLDIKITNTGTDTINNMRLIVEKIPNEWTKIEPPLITQVEPKKTVLFFVTITTPKDLKPQTFPTKITVAADEALVKRETQLKVLESPFPPSVPTVTPEVVKKVEEKPIEKEQYLIFLMILAIVLIGVLIFKFGKPIQPIKKPTKIIKEKPLKELRIVKRLEKAYKEGLISKEMYLRTKNKLLKRMGK